MRKGVPGRARKRQQGRANDQLLAAKHLQSLGKFRQHGLGQFSDDSGNDCLIGALIVPN
jgi:hypothetical protein